MAKQNKTSNEGDSTDLYLQFPLKNHFNDSHGNGWRHLNRQHVSPRYKVKKGVA